MIITINSQRFITKDNIKEIFTWTPSTRATIDDFYAYSQLIRLIANKMSLHYTHKLKLITIDTFKTTKQYIYHKPKEINFPPILKAVVNTKNLRNIKKCSSCTFYKDFCILKGKKYKQEIYNCRYWVEDIKPYIVKGTIHVS